MVYSCTTIRSIVVQLYMIMSYVHQVHGRTTLDYYNYLSFNYFVSSTSDAFYSMKKLEVFDFLAKNLA